MDSMAYYAYNRGTTYWRDYAREIINHANSFLDKNEAEIEEATEFKLSNGQWCVDFVRLCCKLAGVHDSDYTEIIPNLSSSTYMRDWFKKNYPNAFHEGVEGIQPGDIAFIEKTSDPEKAEHTCIVIAAADENGKVNTINGNWTNGAVKTQKFPYTQAGKTKQIKWYVHPDYEKANNR